MLISTSACLAYNSNSNRGLLPYTLSQQTIDENEAKARLKEEILTLIPNKTNDLEITTFSYEVARYILENNRHGWNMFGFNYYYHQKELYNSLLNEIGRYIQETSYTYILSKLKNRNDQNDIANKISDEISQQFEAIIIQSVQQLKKLRPGHVSPFLGRSLRTKINARLRELGYMKPAASRPTANQPQLPTNQTKPVTTETQPQAIQNDKPLAITAQTMASDNYNMHAARGECSICIESYDNAHQPKTLNCGHTFCQSCLLKQYEIAGAKELKCACCFRHIDTQMHTAIFHPNLNRNNIPSAYSID